MSELVFKILPASATFHAVNYNDKKEKQQTAQMVHFENFGLLHLTGGLPDKKEIIQYLENYSAFNTKAKNKQFHAMLSCKGNVLTHEQLKDKALQVMEGLGYKDQPTLIYAHRDTANNHVHIVTTRIDKNGHKINDSFEKKRAAQILLQLLQRDVNKEWQASLQNSFAYKFSTEAQFRLLMEKQGYSITIGKENLQFIKYGALQGELSKQEISDRLQKTDNVARIRQIKAIIEKYQQQYDTELKPPLTYTDKPQLKSELSIFLQNKLGIECVFFSNKQDKVHGYTIIDHATKTVFKGSEIMPLSALIAPSVKSTDALELQNTQQPDDITIKEEATHAQPLQPLAEQERQQQDASFDAGDALSIIIHESEKQQASGISGYEQKPLRKKRRLF